MVAAVVGVYVNVWAADDPDHESDVVLNVPPAPPSLSVIVSVVASAGVIVKVAALWTTPEAGPPRV